MGIIYKEMVSYKKASFLKIILLLIFFLLTFNLMVNSAHYSSRYNVAIEIFVLFGSAVAIAMMSVSYNLFYKSRLSYTYKLIDRELIFERKVGSGNKKVILGVDMKHAEFFVYSAQGDKIKDIDRVFNFVCGNSRKDTSCLIAFHKDKKIKVFFKPSPGLILKLENINKLKCANN
ncbi:hypothetical protein OXPF_33060 [Oxobacter pfennigii]|uniref:Uncharacterized protein n=1 Tax=Oxobacter pfennigii TaxID=36849 RepID=A0A0N8NSV1_9CLOT|nr:hypothetical protein [Oxobacter pfennigii]KPU43056.1 hypothetical protein OXPF_33060 [Oxobacter pfennigii]